jgi:very-short-patch-repair endonuclease
MSDWANDTRDDALRGEVAEFDRIASLTESPIERALFWGLVGCGGVNKYVPRGSDWLALVDWDHMWTAWVRPQSEVTACGNKYRVDFLVELFVTLNGGPRGTYRLVIECDGHDFHERTKEQAARDRSRDRALLSAGCQVIRFTGSEIFKSAAKCGGEAMEAITRLSQVALKPYFDEFARSLEERDGAAR